jgi:hypothetical protein
MISGGHTWSGELIGGMAAITPDGCIYIDSVFCLYICSVFIGKECTWLQFNKYLLSPWGSLYKI